MPFPTKTTTGKASDWDAAQYTSPTVNHGLEVLNDQPSAARSKAVVKAVDWHPWSTVSCSQLHESNGHGDVLHICGLTGAVCNRTAPHTAAMLAGRYDVDRIEKITCSPTYRLLHGVKVHTWIWSSSYQPHRVPTDHRSALRATHANVSNTTETTRTLLAVRQDLRYSCH